MILKGTFFSNVLKMETGITIYAPDKIKEKQKYKVIYLLHGLYGRTGDLVDYTMLPVYANTYDAIVVMPDGAKSFYTDMKFGQRYFTYITEEIPKVCKSYFNISEKRNDTIIAGASMGGYGALKCALSKPEVYGTCFAVSSPCLFLKEGLDAMRGNEEMKEFSWIADEFWAVFGKDLEWNKKNEILELAKETEKKSIKPKIYMFCGKEDGFYNDNVRMSKELKKLNFDYSFEDWHGKHDWDYFNNGIKKIFEILNNK